MLMLIANAIKLVSISYEYTTANHFNFLIRHWKDYVQLSVCDTPGVKPVFHQRIFSREATFSLCP